MEMISICRTCDGTEISSLHKLTDHMEKYPDKMLSDLLEEVAKVDLPDSIAEKLPQYMCDGCTTKLLDAYHYLTQARAATKLMMEQLSEEEPAVKSECLEESPMEHCSNPLLGEAEDNAEIHPDTTQSSDPTDVDVKPELIIEQLSEKEPAVKSECLEETSIEQRSNPLLGEQIVVEDNAEIPNTTQSTDPTDVDVKPEADINMLREQILSEANPESSDPTQSSDPIDVDVKPELMMEQLSKEGPTVTSECFQESPMDPLLGEQIVAEDNAEIPDTTQSTDPTEDVKPEADITMLRETLDSLDTAFLCDGIKEESILNDDHSLDDMALQQLPNQRITENTNQQEAELNQKSTTTLDNKPFKCNICEKEFNNRVTMPNHRREHNGEKLPDSFVEKLQYMCDECTSKLLDAYGFVTQARDITEVLMEQLIKDESNQSVEPECFQESQMTDSSNPLIEEQIKTEANAEIPDTTEQLNMDESIQSVEPECFPESQMEDSSNPLIKEETVTEANAEIPDTTESTDPTDDVKPEVDITMLRETLDSLDTAFLCDGIKQESIFNDDDSLDDVPLQHLVDKWKAEKSTKINEEATTTSVDNSEQGEKRWKCDYCTKSFNTGSQWRIHRRIHTGIKPYKCESCDKAYTQSYSLEMHRRTHTGEKPFKCELCKKTFKQSYGLKIHRQKRTCEKHIQCDVCEKEKKSKKLDKMQIHRCTHTGAKRYKCNFCEKKFSMIKTMYNHQRTHTTEKPFKCDICEMKFHKRETMQNHRLKHTKNKIFNCKLCEKSYSRLRDLETHERTHTGEKPFKCDLCEKRYNRRNNLNAHRLTHTNERPFKCKLCEKSFCIRSYLKTHERRMHSGAKRYKCKFCEKLFSSIEPMRKHRRTHTSEKRFECDMCEMKFHKLDNMNNHRLTHTDNKPFNCKLCDKSYSRLNYLQTHERTHSGVKPFKCDVCEKAFYMRNTLNSHRLTHTSTEKLFKCKLCEKSYGLLSYLKSHERRSHTAQKPKRKYLLGQKFSRIDRMIEQMLIRGPTYIDEKPFKCDSCEKAFHRPEKLKEHRRMHTEE